MKIVIHLIVGLVWLALSLSAAAAPLDALLTALPEKASSLGFVELGLDRMNGSLDFFKVRDKDPATVGTRTGDYRGAHVAGSVLVGNGLWLSGSLWQRAIDTAADTYHYDSWQVSGLYRFIEAAEHRPAVALRLAAWGNRAAQTETTTPVTVPGAILNTVKVTAPADRQLQADLVGTWMPMPNLDVSAMLGVGATQLSYGALTATTKRNGCDYNLAFNGNDIYGSLAAPCNSSGGVIQQFYDRSGDYGVDVVKEIAWHGAFAQTGVNLAWRSEPWTLVAGYVFLVVRRDAVDSILASRGKPVHTKNQNVTLEADYRFHPHLSGFVRTQLSSNLFFNDIPVTYNSATSERFGHRYSLYTIGLRAEF